MKLVVAVVQGKDADELIGAVARRGLPVTQVHSAGGFLRDSNVTLLLGVEDEQVPAVYDLLRENCHTRVQYVNPLLPVVEPTEFAMPNSVEVEVGGATVFVLKMARYVRL